MVHCWTIYIHNVKSNWTSLSLGWPSGRVYSLLNKMRGFNSRSRPNIVPFVSCCLYCSFFVNLLRWSPCWRARNEGRISSVCFVQISVLCWRSLVQPACITMIQIRWNNDNSQFMLAYAGGSDINFSRVALQFANGNDYAERASSHVSIPSC